MFCSVCWLCRGIGGLDAGVGGELLLLDVIEPEGLARQLDIVTDVRRSRTSSFGLTMKLVTYQPTTPIDDVADAAGATASTSQRTLGRRRPR